MLTHESGPPGPPFASGISYADANINYLFQGLFLTISSVDTVNNGFRVHAKRKEVKCIKDHSYFEFSTTTIIP